MKNRRGASVHKVMMPEYLEYSEKDDKFRLIGSGVGLRGTIDLDRIIICKPHGESGSVRGGKRNCARTFCRFHKADFPYQFFWPKIHNKKDILNGRKQAEGGI